MIFSRFRAPSPLMETSKLKPSWQQQQQQQQGGLLPTPGVKPWTPMPGIDLLVTNLDSQMTRKELKRHLVAAISEHCRVSQDKVISDYCTKVVLHLCV